MHMSSREEDHHHIVQSEVRTTDANILKTAKIKGKCEGGRSRINAEQLKEGKKQVNKACSRT